MTLSLHWLFIITSISSFSNSGWILLPHVQLYSPRLSTADPFLPAQSAGFQVPFNTVLITALSAQDNKFPLPAKTIRVEQCRWKRCTRPYSLQGLLPLVATSAELETHCPSCGRCLQCTAEQSRAARGSISGILERELVQEGKAVRAKVLLILEWGVLQRHFLPFNSY